MKVKQFNLKHSKRTKSRFLDILFGTLGASLLGTIRNVSLKIFDVASVFNLF